MYAVVGLWVTSLLALLTVGRHVSDDAALVLSGVTMTSAAFVVADCYGALGLLRALALVGGVGIAFVAQALPGDIGDTLSRVLAPLATALLIALVERRRRRRQRVPNW